MNIQNMEIYTEVSPNISYKIWYIYRSCTH